MVSAICADKRIGDPLEGMSLSDCGERCEGEEECEFHTFIPAEIEDFSKVRNDFENVTRKWAAIFQQNQTPLANHRSFLTLQGTCTLYGECRDLQLETVEITRDEL